MRDLIIRELGPDQDPILKRDRVISQKLGTMASHKPLKHLEAVVKLAKKNPPSHKTSKKIGGKPVYYAWCSKGPMNSWTHPDEVPRPRNHACICYGIKGRTIILYGRQKRCV